MSEANRGEFIQYDDPAIGDVAAAFGDSVQAILKVAPSAEPTVLKYHGFSVLQKGPLALPEEYDMVPETDEPVTANTGELAVEVLIPIGEKRPPEVFAFGLAQAVVKTLHVTVNKEERCTVETDRRLAIGVKKADDNSEELFVTSLASGTTRSVHTAHYPKGSHEGIMNRSVETRESKREAFVRSLSDLEKLYERITSHVAMGKSLEDRRQLGLPLTGTS
jgi:hypothetical protein